MPALKPLSPPYREEIRRILDRYPQTGDGTILRLFRVFANSLRFLSSKGVLNLLDAESPLTARERELVILRVTANLNCEYEWGVHVAVFAEAAELTAEQVRATKMCGPREPCWSQPESLLLECVDDLCHHATITGDLLAGFQRQWTLEQQLEIFALCGNYHTVCFVANTAVLEPERYSARFPLNP